MTKIEEMANEFIKNAPKDVPDESLFALKLAYMSGFKKGTAIFSGMLISHNRKDILNFTEETLNYQPSLDDITEIEADKYADLKRIIGHKNIFFEFTSKPSTNLDTLFKAMLEDCITWCDDTNYLINNFPKGFGVEGLKIIIDMAQKSCNGLLRVESVPPGGSVQVDNERLTFNSTENGWVLEQTG